MGDDVQLRLLSFVHQTSALSGVGSIAMFITSILLLNTIDATFNRIWRIKRTKRTLFRLLILLCFLLLGPVMVMISVSVTTYTMALPYISDTISLLGMQQLLLLFLSMLPTMMLLGFLYHWIPNTRVLWRHAFAGAGIAAILFELAKYLFALYIAWFPTYELLYGALAAVPLLLIWFYVSWFIVLFGAELTYLLGPGKQFIVEDPAE